MRMDIESTFGFTGKCESGNLDSFLLSDLLLRQKLIGLILFPVGVKGNLSKASDFETRA